GYKAYDHTGAQLNLADASEVIAEISKIDALFDIPVADNDLIQIVDASFDDIYLKRVKEVQIHNEPKKVKIVYSPLHGAGGPVIPKFLQSEGYDIYPYLPQMEVDPTFGTLKSSNPEEAPAF